MCYVGADGRNPYSVEKIVKYERTADRLKYTCKCIFMHRVQPCCPWFAFIKQAGQVAVIHTH